jgi:hypothetical protein
MTLKEHVLSDMRQTMVHNSGGEKLIEIGPWSVMRLMPDGSAILYRNPLGTVQSLALSRHDLEVIKSIALPVRMFTPGPDSEKDVHTEHCCVIHGCKYGDDRGYDNNTCPVTTKKKKQSFACESCYADAEGWDGTPEPDFNNGMGE